MNLVIILLTAFEAFESFRVKAEAVKIMEKRGKVVVIKEIKGLKSGFY